MYDDMPAELRQKYCVENMTQKEIADELGVSKSTISREMDKYDIKAQYNGSIHPSFSQSGGYLTVQARTSNGRKSMYVHRLIAFAHFDGSLDDFSNMQIHHRNKYKFDNRPDNLEVLSGRRHQATHHMDKWVNDGGWPVLLSPKYAGDS